MSFLTVRMPHPHIKQVAKFGKMSSWVPVITTTLVVAAGLLSVSQVQAQKAAIFENLTLSPKFSPDPTIIRGISGGLVPAKTIAGRADTSTGPCVGFMDENPDHTLVLNAFFNYLSVVVEAPEDTTMVISGPGGTWCNDDYVGKNPGIGGQWLPGTYKIWIGSYDKSKYIPYIIKITEVNVLNPGSSGP